MYSTAYLRSYNMARTTADDASPMTAPRVLYATPKGEAFLGDAIQVLRQLKAGSVNLVVTSPPYALHFKKAYGNASQSEYVKWFLPFAKEIFRVLKDDGSFVLNIGGSWTPGQPTRSIYQYRLLVELIDAIGFHLAQECYWYNPAKMPVPAEWVTVRRVRVKDSVEHVWWLSKTPNPKANNRKVLKPYSKDMLRLNKRGVRETVRPSGHVINKSWTALDNGGSIPSNVIGHGDDAATAEDMMIFGNNTANDVYTKRCKELGITIHPARFPSYLPKFFIDLLTDENDLVVDPFAGSNTTGAVCEHSNRRWIACDLVEEYLESSIFRFDAVKRPKAKGAKSA